MNPFVPVINIFRYSNIKILAVKQCPPGISLNSQWIKNRCSLRSIVKYTHIKFNLETNIQKSLIFIDNSRCDNYVDHNKIKAVKSKFSRRSVLLFKGSYKHGLNLFCDVYPSSFDNRPEILSYLESGLHSVWKSFSSVVCFRFYLIKDYINSIVHIKTLSFLINYLVPATNLKECSGGGFPSSPAVYNSNSHEETGSFLPSGYNT